MKNKVVTQDTPSYYYSIKDSDIGKSKKRLHPYLDVRTVVTNAPHFLKVGDILRCDGYPFMSRPKPVSLLKSKRGDIVKVKVITHNPVKLPSGFWVLRPVSNIIN